MSPNLELDRQAALVSGARPGNRNSCLNKSAFSLRRLIQRKALLRSEVESRLLAAAITAGLGEGEARQTIASGLGVEPGPVVRGRPNRGARQLSTWPVTESTQDFAAATSWEHTYRPDSGEDVQFGTEDLHEFVREPLELDTADASEKEHLPVLAFTVFQDGHRRRDNALTHSCLTLDVDEGHLSKRDLEEILAGLVAFAHTSFSHTPEDEKWRVIVPLSREATPGEYEKIWRWAADRIPGVDLKTKDVSRAYYQPARRPGFEYDHLAQIDGQYLDVDAVLELAALEEGEAELPPAVPLDIVPLSGLGEGDWMAGQPTEPPVLLTYEAGGVHRPFIRGAKTAMLAGPGGAFKTHAVCALALSVATARPWLSTFHVPNPGNVLLALGEEELDEVMRRLQTLARHLDLSEEERRNAYERVHILAAYGKNVRLVDELGVPTGVFSSLTESLWSGGRDWRAIILDPGSRFMGARSEVDSHAATMFVEALEQLTQAPGRPAVVVAHHVSKGAMRAVASDQGAPRGSSALVDGVRWLGLLERPKLKEDAVRGLEAVGLTQDRLVRLSVQKSNYTPPASGGFTFKIARGGVLEALTREERSALAGNDPNETPQGMQGPAPSIGFEELA